jgi:hypothetical protein
LSRMAGQTVSDAPGCALANRLGRVVGAPVHSGTAPSATCQYTFDMGLNSIKATVTAVWVFVVCATAIALQVGSVSGWTVIAALAILPPLVMMWRWNDPPATMSEIIDEARR